MDFELSDEQKLLKESVDRWASDRYGTLAQINASRRQPTGFSETTWRELGDLGLLGLPFAEADGGFGGGATETMVVMEAMGRALAPEPYLASVILGGGAVALGGDQAQRQRLLPQLAEGTLRLALAHGERQARYDLTDVATSAHRSGGGYVLDGCKTVALSADSAGLLVVSARLGGGRRDSNGVCLFLVPRDAPGVEVKGYPTQDGGRAADVTMTNVEVPIDAMLGLPGEGLAVIERVTENAIAALAAEAVGVMDALLALTVDYLKTRRQFGAAIGGFQALQHRAVDMLTAVEQARSMALYATMMVQSDDPHARRAALSAAKVQINRSARLVGQQAVQLHGGVGMTMEYHGAHYFRRLVVIEQTFGDTPHHLRQLAMIDDADLS